MAVQLPTGPELVEAAKQGLGIRDDRGSDRRLDLKLFTAYGVSPGQPLIGRWRSGRQAPSFDYALILLDAAGFLKVETIIEFKEHHRRGAVPQGEDDALEQAEAAAGAFEEADSEETAQLRRASAQDD